MIDPLRPGVRDTVAVCHQVGVTVSMVTGDHPVTALAIARDLGLAPEPGQVVTGAELAGMSSVELEAVVRSGRVFARVAPRQSRSSVPRWRRADDRRSSVVTICHHGVHRLLPLNGIMA